MRFVFDLDGTLSFDDMTISDEIKSVLLSAQQFGHEIIFASARSYRDCLGLLGHQLSKNLIIGLNGGLVYRDGQLVAEKQLDLVGYQVLLDFCITYHLPFFVDNSFHYSGQSLEKIPFIASVDPLKKAERLKLADLSHPIKAVVYMGENEFLLAEMLEGLTNLEVSYHEHEKCLYVNPLGINKATTILEQCGEDVIAFGNDKNDIEMFKSSLYAVQVGDYPVLTAFADEVISQEEVAEKINSLFVQFKGR